MKLITTAAIWGGRLAWVADSLKNYVIYRILVIKHGQSVCHDSHLFTRSTEEGKKERAYNLAIFKITVMLGFTTTQVSAFAAPLAIAEPAPGILVVTVVVVSQQTVNSKVPWVGGSRLANQGSPTKPLGVGVTKANRESPIMAAVVISFILMVDRILCHKDGKYQGKVLAKSSFDTAKEVLKLIIRRERADVSTD
jgi:hypothetical protein